MCLFHLGHVFGRQGGHDALGHVDVLVEFMLKCPPAVDRGREGGKEGDEETNVTRC